MKKGITMIGLLFGTIVMLMYLFLLPAIQSTINLILPQLDQTTGLLVSLFPLFLFFVILIGILYSGSPQQEFVG